MNARETVVWDALARARSGRPELLTAEWTRWFDAYWEWLRFHLPRLNARTGAKLARGAVLEASARASRGLRPDAPPEVPDAVRGVWRASYGTPDGMPAGWRALGAGQARPMAGGTLL